MTADAQPLPADIAATEAMMTRGDYLPDRGLATAVFLALRLRRPLLLEGEPGTGKTEVARVLAASLGRQLIRLQCYEGLDLDAAAYQWNHLRQLIEIRLADADAAYAAQATDAPREARAQELFSERFLIARPLLRALQPAAGGAPVLLIDELDRADEPFEAFLLELLADFQLTIPELGTIRAPEPPIVVLTTNRTREVHDALRRRCLYHWVDFPDAARELEIIRRKTPGIGEQLARQVVAFVQRLRGADLFKMPGVAETIDWSRALLELDMVSLDPAVVDSTLGVLLKYQDDIARVRGSEAARLLEELRAVTPGAAPALPGAAPP